MLLEMGKFVPIALGGCGYGCWVCLYERGPGGLGDDVRGEVLVVAGPQLCSDLSWRVLRHTLWGRSWSLRV